MCRLIADLPACPQSTCRPSDASPTSVCKPFLVFLSTIVLPFLVRHTVINHPVLVDHSSTNHSFPSVTQPPTTLSQASHNYPTLFPMRHSTINHAFIVRHSTINHAFLVLPSTINHAFPCVTQPSTIPFLVRHSSACRLTRQQLRQRASQRRLPFSCFSATLRPGRPPD